MDVEFVRLDEVKLILEDRKSSLCPGEPYERGHVCTPVGRVLWDEFEEILEEISHLDTYPGIIERRINSGTTDI